MSVATRYRWLIARYLPIILVVALSLLGVLVWFVWSIFPEWGAPAKTDSSPPQSSPAVAREESVRVQQKKQEARLVTEGFVKAYYTREEATAVLSLEERMNVYVERLVPYATDSFISQYTSQPERVVVDVLGGEGQREVDQIQLGRGNATDGIEVTFRLTTAVSETETKTITMWGFVQLRETPDGLKVDQYVDETP